MAMSPRLLRPRATFDPDAAAYIRAVELADAQALEVSVKRAIDNFVRGCKADDIWSSLKASCILMGARTLAGALTPLTGTAPTNVNVNFVSGDYDRKLGLVGNGSSKYLNSNRNANADPQDNFHMSLAVSSFGTPSLIVMGAGATGAGSTQFSAEDLRCRSGSAATRTITNIDTGLRGMSRTAGAEFVSRWLGSNQTHSIASQTPFNGDIFVYARNFSGPGFYTDMRCYWYSIGESLDLALLDTRVAALYTAIGAAI